MASSVFLAGCPSAPAAPATADAGPTAAPAATPVASADPGTLLPGLDLAEDDAADAGSRDHMRLETDGLSKDVWSSGWASIPHPSHPEYAFQGPLGCAGSRFKTKLTRNIRLDIGFTARKAFVIVAEEPYVLAKPPVVDGKTLVWSGDFLHADGRKRRFHLRIDCPLPGN